MSEMPDFKVDDLVEFHSFGHLLSGVVIETGSPNSAGILFSVVWSPAFDVLPARRMDTRKFVYLYEDDNYYNSRTLPRIISRCSSLC